MKEKIRRDAIVPYKELRRRSPMPYLAAGAACLTYGLARPVYRVGEYLGMAAVGFLFFLIGRLFWRDEIRKVELPPNTGVAQADQLLAEAREALASFRGAQERITSTNVQADIDGIVDAGVKILARLEEDPSLHSQLRTFLRYYLPTTRKLLDARAGIEAGGEVSENAREVAARCDHVLPEIRRAFEKQLDALDKHKFLDLQVEMDVLEGMLKSDNVPGGDRSLL